MSKSVVVTGANSGIGLATATHLASAGYDVIGTVRDERKAALLHEAAAKNGTTVRTVLLDAADADSTKSGFAEIAEMTDGGPWAVVNNAGTAQAGAIEDVDDELVRRQLEINLVAPARIARLVLPAMRERGDGRIINVSSIAGRVATPLMGWYCASKHGLEAMSDALRMEVAPYGVKVVLVEPGSFGTDIWDRGGESLPPPATPEYAAAYDRARTATGLMRRAPDPIWVARVIRLALATPVPLPRYLVGVDAVAGVLLEQVTPTFVADFVKGLGAGVRRLPLPGL